MTRRGAFRSLATAAALALCIGVAAPSATRAADGLVTMLPEAPRAGCEGSRARLYSECGDQRALFEAARARAAAEGKAVLVSAGAEWCIWCHVLSATLQGFVDSASAMEDDTLEAQADALRLATAERFVVVHIEIDKSPNGEALLAEIGAAGHIRDWIPFPFGVDAEGRFVAPLGERDAETGNDEAPTEESRNTENQENADQQSAPLGYDRRMLRTKIIALAEKIEQANR